MHDHNVKKLFFKLRYSPLELISLKKLTNIWQIERHEIIAIN